MHSHYASPGYKHDLQCGLQGQILARLHPASLHTPKFRCSSHMVLFSPVDEAPSVHKHTQVHRHSTCPSGMLCNAYQAKSRSAKKERDSASSCKIKVSTQMDVVRASTAAIRAPTVVYEEKWILQHLAQVPSLHLRSNAHLDTAVSSNMSPSWAMD